MSKMNALRLINLNYNNNAIHVSDEIFHFNGESTLMSLRNGGGKSVLVQMMTAPFVHKRYRDAKDRPFESYFTTSKPSFILVEWALDHGAGYVLTGMMIRRSQDSENSNGENLEIVNLISEYEDACLQDIHHLPVVEKGKKGMILKNFSACRQLFESYKKDRNMKFFCYDMNNGAQSRQYFEKLKEYQINYKEWETIIKKVNLKESGLSELFSDCRDEKGLVEKWFLETVESKLNKERNRMKEFQQILEKYVGQYKDNRSKIKRRDTIRQFKEEALQIQEKAGVYAEAGKREQSQKNKIAHFITELNVLQNRTHKEIQELSGQIEGLHGAITHIEYEKLSYEIHNLKKEQENVFSNQNLIAMERDALERKSEKIERGLQLMACARQQEKLQEEKEELDLIQQKLSVFREQEKELEPERNQLGYALKGYYQKEIEVNQKEQETNHAHMLQLSEQISQEKAAVRTLEQQIREAVSQKGALESKVQSYDQQEERYNQRYGEQFTRNILGEYEPGFLEIQQMEYERILNETIHSRVQKRQLLEQTGEKEKRLERRMMDLRETFIRMQEEKKQKEALLKNYQQELEVRRVILKYLDLDKSALFDLEKILFTSERKLQETAIMQRNLEKEEDELQKEYQKLTKGTWLELPAKLEQKLKNLGIPLVYGMEWLQKNGYSLEKNQALVSSHPFLPYALILSGADLDKLSHQTDDVYTSFPVPIVLREHLELKDSKSQNLKLKDSELRDYSSIIHLDKIQFYLLFNQELLDAERLNELTAEIANRIVRKQEAIEIRKNEYREYFSRKETIQNQKVDKKTYRAAEEDLTRQEENLKQTEIQVQTAVQELSLVKTEKQKLETQINTINKEIQERQQQKEDFSFLCQAYERYKENRKTLERCRKKITSHQECQELAQAQVQQLQEQQRTCENQQDGFVRELEKLKEKLQRYERYEQPDHEESQQPERNQQSISEMEIRYIAITSNMSVEMQDLEQQEQRVTKRYVRAGEELERLYKKYRLKAGAWKGVRYDSKEEEHQEELLKDYRKNLEIKNQQWNEMDKKMAVLSNQISDRIKRMQNEYGKEQPVPLTEIRNTDFDSRKKQLCHEEEELKNQVEKVQNQLNGYNENLTALSEYNDFQAVDSVIWEEDFSKMDRKTLRNFKGILVRDFNQFIRERQEAKDGLIHVLNQMIRKSAFQEDYYKKPLESMLELTGSASQVLRQLETTIQSYDGLMEKLEVDISLVEKEKKRIVELLEDYIQEVHQNLGKIDQNSTISIRGRAVKMLKIQMPAWEDNENLYHIRLQDFIDELTQKGIEIFEHNENAQEYFGIKMTTRNLYDTVIGISNIQIRLYKIEEQREYPITWAEVARNSGGEGFLSAFVILSSLLYYMRKDDTDIFAEGNEGKVLVMDNPFAQTNASHLLIPLMDMAKKTNTQLICLTGLGGESIYNRFDNIYVMNLVTSGLRSGNQYLRADHLRGNEPEVMVVSQVEVVEQIKLEF